MNFIYNIYAQDICSSWTSHLPAWYKSIPIDGRVTVGIGMNAAELAQNDALTSYEVPNITTSDQNFQLTRLTQLCQVRDLNKSPTLAFRDNSFDVVLLQLSVDYLTQPLNVFKEVSRVLNSGGEVVVRYLKFLQC